MDDDWKQWVRKHELVHEQIDTKLDTILEYVSVIPTMNERLGRVEDRLDGVEARLTSVEVTLADHSADLKEIKQIVGGHAEAIVELKAASHTH
jgi:hypothetical protein